MTTFSGTQVPLKTSADFAEFTSDFPLININSALDQVFTEKTQATYTDIVIIDPYLDFIFAQPDATSSGVAISFGFDINFSYDVPSRINQRLFPVSVELATLFPGDVPRGDPLN